MKTNKKALVINSMPSGLVSFWTFFSLTWSEKHKPWRTDVKTKHFKENRGSVINEL